MRIAAFVAGVGAWCAGVSACSGGSVGLSRPDYIRRAGAICRDASDAVRQIKPDASTPASLAGSIGKVVAIERAATSQLRALRPPAPDAHTLGRWLELVDNSLDELDAARRAAAAGDAQSADAANVRSGSLQEQADRAALGYGVHACAAPPSTPVPAPAR